MDLILLQTSYLYLYYVMCNMINCYISCSTNNVIYHQGLYIYCAMINAVHLVLVSVLTPNRKTLTIPVGHYTNSDMTWSNYLLFYQSLVRSGWRFATVLLQYVGEDEIEP